ncbi:hypothetical protein H257_11340 [Aphanomyces astaci]|uniref:RNase H type-1 domain-containing protein n=1 Tax=Aphanomyces astaci TaxID=112090 RepID=W4G423_APHAT|nr:hypothetical protein H257_11340 [Aphanomyces astaci]ETV74026.1 hypothetical protein H257_11340 [Aphanomyces astaci]|eukprot:XP_009836539.1 hypothetical protein H257_11340 [Aphanomyces astaci]
MSSTNTAAHHAVLVLLSRGIGDSYTALLLSGMFPEDHAKFVRKVTWLHASQTWIHRWAADRLPPCPPPTRLVREIPVLGDLVGVNGYRADPDKIRAISDWLSSPPSRTFVAGLPLFRLLLKDAPWVWDSECQSAFDGFKHNLQSAPILALPDFAKPFSVVCDASPRQFHQTERAYPVHHMELLSMNYALTKFRIYLLGAKPFVVYTDHASLRTATNTSHMSYLSKCTFSVQYKPDKDNILADALYRRPDLELTTIGLLPSAHQDHGFFMGASPPLSIPNELWSSVSMNFMIGLPRDARGNTASRTPLAPSSIMFLRSGRSIISDSDPRFTAKFWMTLFTLCDTSLAISTSDHPESDGQTERANRILEDILRSCLQLAQSRGYTHLTVYGDSQLLMRQMQGIYRVSHPGLRAQYLQAHRLAATIHCTWCHRPREGNQTADFLSKLAPDECASYTSLDGPESVPLPSRQLTPLYDFLDLDLAFNPG